MKVLLFLFLLAFAKPPPPKPSPVHSNTPSPTPTVASSATPTEPIKPPQPLVVLPTPPVLSQKGHALILEFEGFDARPAWPGGASGVTVGWGYDLGYYSKTVILNDWRELSETPRVRLSKESGYTGQRAKARIPAIRDILIDKGIGTRVFDNVDVAREYASCKRAFSGFEDLRPNAQAALISLTFNRGTSFVGPNRTEMRAIRDLVPRRDYKEMANQLRKMTRVWRGTSIENGMRRRRNAEAQLMETI